MLTLTLILDSLLVLTALGMLLLGKYGITRQLATVPVTAAVLDMVFATKVLFSLTPVLSCVLMALQTLVLCFCLLVLKEDRAMARKKENRRRRRREMAATRVAFEQAAERRQPIVVCA